MGGASWGFVSLRNDFTRFFTEYGGLEGIGFVKSYRYSSLLHPEASGMTDNETAD